MKIVKLEPKPYEGKIQLQDKAPTLFLDLDGIDAFLKFENGSGRVHMKMQQNGFALDESQINTLIEAVRYRARENSPDLTTDYNHPEYRGPKVLPAGAKK